MEDYMIGLLKTYQKKFDEINHRLDGLEKVLKESTQLLEAIMARLENLEKNQ
jgi:predicted metal-dependent hydrolase